MIDQYPDIAGLALLAEINAAGSMGAAAMRFGISQPAASQRIRALEQAMGVTLIHRRATGSRLTSVGTVVVDWAAPLLAAAAEFAAGAAALSAEGGNRVRITASLTVADYLLPKWLRSLRQALPDASVFVQATNSEAVAGAVRDGAADIGFVEGPEPPRGLRSRAIADDRLVVVVGASHPWAERTAPVSAQELAAAPLVLREESSGTRRVLDRALAERGLKPEPIMELGSTTAIKQAVRDGAYASVISRLAVEAELASRVLVEVPLEEIDLRRKLRAVWRQAAPPHGVAGALLAISTGQ
jgi:molybdate transport repressor ModE-like protein